MSEPKTKEPPYRDLFYESRAERLKLLDNSARMCKRDRLSPTVEQLQEAVQIGYELLENLHQNNVQERLCALTETAVALAKKIESKPKVLHVDLKAQEERTLMEALEKVELSGKVELIEIDDEAKPPTISELLKKVESCSRFSSDRPNLCGCMVKHMRHVGGDSGRTTSNKSNFDEKLPECTCSDNECTASVCKGGCERCR